MFKMSFIANNRSLSDKVLTVQTDSPTGSCVFSAAGPPGPDTITYLHIDGCIIAHDEELH